MESLHTLAQRLNEARDITEAVEIMAGLERRLLELYDIQFPHRLLELCAYYIGDRVQLINRLFEAAYERGSWQRWCIVFSYHVANYDDEGYKWWQETGYSLTAFSEQKYAGEMLTYMHEKAHHLLVCSQNTPFFVTQGVAADVFWLYQFNLKMIAEDYPAAWRTLKDARNGFLICGKCVLAGRRHIRSESPACWQVSPQVVSQMVEQLYKALEAKDAILTWNLEGVPTERKMPWYWHGLPTKTRYEATQVGLHFVMLDLSRQFPDTPVYRSELKKGEEVTK